MIKTVCTADLFATSDPSSLIITSSLPEHINVSSEIVREDPVILSRDSQHFLLQDRFVDQLREDDLTAAQKMFIVPLSSVRPGAPDVSLSQMISWL